MENSPRYMPHFGLDLNTVERLAVVDTHHRHNHLRHNKHVPEVGLDPLGALHGLGGLLGLSQPPDERRGLPLEPPSHPPACPGVDKLHELLVAQVQELVEVNTAEGELAELPLLL